MGGVDVDCGRIMILGFEESAWAKEYAFSFGRFGSTANMNLQSKDGKVIAYEE